MIYMELNRCTFKMRKASMRQSGEMLLDSHMPLIHRHQGNDLISSITIQILEYHTVQIWVSNNISFHSRTPVILRQIRAIKSLNANFIEKVIPGYYDSVQKIREKEEVKTMH